MRSVGVEAVDSGGGALHSPEQVVQDVLNNLYTSVLSTVYCAGWSITWAMSVAMLIITSYHDCSHLLLLAIEGGPSCEEECNFIDVLLRSLGFIQTLTESTADKGFLSWEWQIERPETAPFTVELRKLYEPDVDPQDFSIMESNGAAPNLFRAAVVSCAEKWGPRKAEVLYVPELHPTRGYRMLKSLEGGRYMMDDSADPEYPSAFTGVCFRTEMAMAARHPKGKSALFGEIYTGELSGGWLTVVYEERDSRRLNDDGDTVNDVLNKSIVRALEKVKRIYAARNSFPPVKCFYEDVAAFKRFWGTG